MKPTKTLVTALQKKELLPTGDIDVDGYYELEAKMLMHIASLRDKPSNVVWFDGECIEKKDDYFGLLSEFIRAADCESETEILQSEVDFDNGRADCSVSRQGSLLNTSWVQDSDWVTSEFLDFTASLLNSDKGEFVDIATGDQTYLAVFLPSDLLKRFKQFRERDTKSRDGFFMQHGESVKQRFGDTKILPIKDYRSVLREFQDSFIDDGPLSQIGSYKKGKAIEVIYCSRWDDALDGYRKIKHLALATERYADMDQWAVAIVCPDEDCYFLSCNPAYDQVIFSEASQFLPSLIGELPADSAIGEYLAVGKSGTWAVYVKEHSVICVGDPSIALAESVSKSVHGNENAKFFDMFIDDCYRPALEKLGYDSGVVAFSDFYSKTNGELSAAFSINANQQDSHDPLEVIINIGIFSPSIASMLGQESTHPKTLLHYVMKFPDDSPANRWLIQGEDTYRKQSVEMCAFIKKSALWAQTVGFDSELLTLYKDDEKFMHAAAVAVKMDEKDQAVRLARQGLDAARLIGSRAGGKAIEMSAALGIELAKETK